MPKVSVIVPVHNAGKYLIPLLESLINQTLKDIEILLVDDGSTDGSRDTLKHYEKKDSRIQVFFRDKADYELFGEKYSVDLGREKATGEYIMFVDHDDELTLNALEILYSYTNNGTVDVVQGRSWTVNEKGKVVYRTNDNFPIPTIICSTDHLKNLLPQQITLHLLWPSVALWACLIKSSFLKGIELPDCIYNDTSFIWKLKLLAHQFCYIPDYIYKQNEHADSVSGSISKDENVFQIFKVFEDLKTFVISLQLPPMFIKYLMLYEFRMIIGHTGGNFTPEVKEKFLNRLAEEIKSNVDITEELGIFFDEDMVKWYKELRE